MTSWGTIHCGACEATKVVVIADSWLGTPPAYARSRFGIDDWTRCTECNKPYCPKHAPTGICDLCLSGSDQPPAEPQGVLFTLSLSADECQVLANVLAHVSGDSTRSQSKFCVSVWNKLFALGFSSQSGNVVTGELRIEHDRHLRHVFPPGVMPPGGRKQPPK